MHSNYAFKKCTHSTMSISKPLIGTYFLKLASCIASKHKILPINKPPNHA